MEISIIIPVYNRASLVLRTLSSVVAQTYRPLHLVLVDNNSTDETWLRLQQFREKNETKDFKITLCQEMKPGAAATRNRGMQEVTGEWVMFFDSDDEMRPDLVEKYVSRIIQNPTAEIVYTDVAIIDDAGTRCVKGAPNQLTIYKHIFHSYLSTQRYVVRRSLVETSGRWNEALLGWNDWELGVRMLLQNPRVVKMPVREPLVVVHSHDDSITGPDFSSRTMWWETSIDAVISVVKNSARKDVKRMLACVEYKRILLAASYTREGSAEGFRLYREVCKHVSSSFLLYTICRLGYRLACRGVKGTARVVEKIVFLL